MSGRVALVNPARHFIANQNGLGYLIPLGLVLIGGPLVDAGFQVRLFDHDQNGWPTDRLVHEFTDFRADYVLLGHSGSTASHKIAIETIRQIRKSLPFVKIVYGGVYPSYAYEAIMVEAPEIDAIVRGEGEETVVHLITAWEAGKQLHEVKGVVWRSDGEIIVNPPRSAIQELDSFRPGWELLEWERYTMFGFEHAAGIQFSRGCPLTCVYCGQWLFWKKWRHRSPQNLVEQLTILKERYGVKFVWFADENFAADRELAREVIQKIIEADLGLSINLNMTAADVVRDKDLMPLYKAAGVDYIVMGVESMKDNVISDIRKNNPFVVSREAVRVLRDHNIISLTNIIYGLEEESWQTLWEKFIGLLELDSDILNAMYLTPHFWTSEGKSTNPKNIIQADLNKWSYRNQVIATSNLRPFSLFLGVKLTELIFHLRPRALWRLISGGDKNYLKIMRQSMLIGIRVVLAEIQEFLFDTRFVQKGSLALLPGAPAKHQDISPLADLAVSETHS
jgi:anaerobic magnesium-protoporphyrin IX monomethyl ester cyclase